MADNENDAATEEWDHLYSLPDAVHRVVWLLESDCVHGDFYCDGDAKSPCHAYCGDGCEVTPCEHMPKFGKSCMVIEWLNGDGPAQDTYEGDLSKPTDGPINPKWVGDYYTWTYPVAPVGAQQDGNQP